MKCDSTLMKANLILLTETHLVNKIHVELLKSVFVDHDLFLSNSSDKFKSLDILKKVGSILD